MEHQEAPKYPWDEIPKKVSEDDDGVPGTGVWFPAEPDEEMPLWPGYRPEPWQPQAGRDLEAGS